jgi:hypothetical protein
MSAGSQLAGQTQKRLGGATGKGWKPGQSGNAGGRPKAALDVQALARTHTTAAVRALAEALRDPKLKVQAAVALLDRAWGKPQQTISTTADGTLTVQHLVAARAISLELLHSIAPPPTIESAPQPRNGNGVALVEPASE